MIDTYGSMSVSEIVEKYNYQYEDLLLDKAVRRILNERPEFVSVEGGRYTYEKS